MQGPFLRKYGVQFTVDFDLWEVDGVDFRVDAVYAAGDVKIMKDEGAEANTKVKANAMARVIHLSTRTLMQLMLMSYSSMCLIFPHR